MTFAPSPVFFNLKPVYQHVCSPYINTKNRLFKVMRIKQLIVHSQLTKMKSKIPTTYMQGDNRDSLGELSHMPYVMFGAWLSNIYVVPGKYSHILVIWVSAAGKDMVFKPFSLGWVRPSKKKIG